MTTPVLAVSNLHRVFWKDTNGVKHAKVFNTEQQAVMCARRVKKHGATDIQWQLETVKVLKLPED